MQFHFDRISARASYNFARPHSGVSTGTGDAITFSSALLDVTMKLRRLQRLGALKGGWGTFIEENGDWKFFTLPEGFIVAAIVGDDAGDTDTYWSYWYDSSIGNTDNIDS